MYTYLPKFYLILSVFIGIFFWFIGLSFLLPIIIYFFFHVWFRKKRVYYKEDLHLKNTILFSPVNGKIVSIRDNINHVHYGENLYEIQIRVSPFREMGIFLPQTAEILDMLVFKGEGWFRWKSSLFPDQSKKVFSGLCVFLKNNLDIRIGLQIVKCPLGLWPELCVIPGDRGKKQVNIGYLPLGGTVLLYLPKKYEIIVSSETDVVAGQTILAGLPELES